MDGILARFRTAITQRTITMLHQPTCRRLGCAARTARPVGVLRPPLGGSNALQAAGRAFAYTSPAPSAPTERISPDNPFLEQRND